MAMVLLFDSLVIESGLLFEKDSIELSENDSEEEEGKENKEEKKFEQNQIYSHTFYSSILLNTPAIFLGSFIKNWQSIMPEVTTPPPDLV
jgi:hypothetical protein